VETGTAPESLFRMATPSECALVEWLKTQVTLTMLEEISTNDYGQTTAEHLAGIQAQLTANPPMGLLPWCPGEVLQLERWTEPDQPYREQPPSRERGHLKRLLACVILLRNGAYVSGEYGLSEEDFFLQTSAASLVQLTRSALALGTPERALGFMLWLFDAQPHPALRPFIAFSALALASAIGFGEASWEEIDQICNWVDSEEEQSRNILSDDIESGRWLVGVNSYECLKGRDQWVLLARQVFDQPQRKYAPEIESTLRRFSERLSADQPTV